MTRSRPLARPCGPSASPNSFRSFPNCSSPRSWRRGRIISWDVDPGQLLRCASDPGLFSFALLGQSLSAFRDNSRNGLGSLKPHRWRKTIWPGVSPGALRSFVPKQFALHQFVDARSRICSIGSRSAKRMGASYSNDRTQQTSSSRSGSSADSGTVITVSVSPSALNTSAL